MAYYFFLPSQYLTYLLMTGQRSIFAKNRSCSTLRSYIDASSDMSGLSAERFCVRTSSLGWSVGAAAACGPMVLPSLWQTENCRSMLGCISSINRPGQGSYWTSAPRHRTVDDLAVEHGQRSMTCTVWRSDGVIRGRTTWSLEFGIFWNVGVGALVVLRRQPRSPTVTNQAISMCSH